MGNIRVQNTDGRLILTAEVTKNKIAKTSNTFFTTNETRKITDYISCPSKNLIYLIQCNKCHCQYIGETKRKLSERFGEHRRSILNYHQLSNPTPVLLHFNQPGHSTKDVHLILTRPQSSSYHTLAASALKTTGDAFALPSRVGCPRLEDDWGRVST